MSKSHSFTKPIVKPFIEKLQKDYVDRLVPFLNRNVKNLEKKLYLSLMLFTSFQIHAASRSSLPLK
jgi:hypothetical protein